jgi:hypothetical protein
MLRGLRPCTAAVLLAGLAGCASPPHRDQTPAEPAGYVGADVSLVVGEALLRADLPPDPVRLAEQAGLEGLVVLECVHQFGKVYRVRFERAGGQQADAEFTRRAITALGAAGGVLSSEPNRLEQLKPSTTARP